MNDGIQLFDTGAPVEPPIIGDTYAPYESINFENGTLVSPGKIDPETHEITMPVYTGKKPVNAENLNHIEKGIKDLENYVIENNSSLKSRLDAVYGSISGPITTDSFPVLCGYKIDEKDVYVVRTSFKMVDLATRVAQKEVSVQMNLIKIVDIRGVMYDSSGENYIPLPDSGTVVDNNGTRLVVNKSTNGKMNVVATVESDRSNFIADVNIYFVYK